MKTKVCYLLLDTDTYKFKKLNTYNIYKESIRIYLNSAEMRKNHCDE